MLQYVKRYTSEIYLSIILVLCFCICCCVRKYCEKRIRRAKLKILELVEEAKKMLKHEYDLLT